VCGYENSRQKFSWRRWFVALNDAKLALLIPFIILGGIYSGVFTPTESAAVAVAIALVIGMVQRTIRLRDFPAMLETSARVNGVILPIIAVAVLFSQALTVLGVPQALVTGLTSISDNRDVIIMMMLVVFIVAGMFMETTPNIVILAPMLLPVAQKIGMDPIHFCVFMITSLGLGFITPPMGLNLFVMSGLTRVSIAAIARRALPFVAAMLLVSIIVGYVPVLSTVLLQR
jgi:tripartite ATP-independent transporter DctM subunit